MLVKLRSEIERGHNQEIEEATLETLEQELINIRESTNSKISQKEQELEREYAETNRVLGFDQTAYLSELASKKSKIKQISDQKTKSYKNKEIKAVEFVFENDLDEDRRRLIEKVELENERKTAEERSRQEKRVVREK